jgi:hypothetical protein
MKKNYPPTEPEQEGAPAAKTNRTRVATSNMMRKFFAIAEETRTKLVFMISSFLFCLYLLQHYDSYQAAKQATKQATKQALIRLFITNI